MDAFGAIFDSFFGLFSQRRQTVREGHGGQPGGRQLHPDPEDLGYSPGEALDFLLGISTIDLAKDEERYRFKLSQAVWAGRYELKGGWGSLRLQDELIRARSVGSKTD